MPGGSPAPPEVVASWPKPNYTNPETRGPALFITCTALSAIGLIVVAARLYARLVITKAPGLDDGIIVVALLLGIGSSVVSIYATEVLYIGHHVWDVPATAFAAIRLNSWLGQWFSNGVLSAVKISILLFYRRLSVTFSNRFLWATWIGIGYNIVCFFLAIFSLLLECRPTSAYWLTYEPKWLAEGHTYSCSYIEYIILPTYSALSVVGDFYSTTLPLCLVYSLDMGIRQKMSLYCLFALGYLVVAAGIARTVFVNMVVNRTYDTTWRLYDALLWVTVEFYVAIICASAPGLKPFIKRFFVETTAQDSPLQNQRRNDYVSQSSGKAYARKIDDASLGNDNNDEESWTQGDALVELSNVRTQNKGDNIGIIVRETGDFFNDRPRHSLIHNENATRLEQYTRPQIRSTAERHYRTRDVPILDSSQTLDDTADSDRGQVVPFSLQIRPTPPPPPTPTTALPSAQTSRYPSFVTISAFPEPQPRAVSRLSEADEDSADDEDIEIELPLQGARENPPVNMKPFKRIRHHIASQVKTS